MNIDFALPATPAIARRLLHISSVCKSYIDEQIIEMARHGLISQDDMLVPLTGVRLAATQFILDCDFRCVIPRLVPDLDRYLILNALKLSGFVGSITIAGSVMEWRSVIRAFHFDDIKILTLKNAFLPENQDGRREGILIIDWTTNVGVDYVAIALAREFQKTIMFGDALQQRNDMSWHANIEYPWWDMAAILFPEMPNRQFAANVNIPKNPLWEMTAGDNKKLAIFFNVFLPHFADTLGYSQAK